MLVNKVTKLAELSAKKAEYEAKLKFKYKHFRGVAHEDAAGELKYVEIKVLEDHLEGIKKEIETLEKGQ
jgi:hypothetical protein